MSSALARYLELVEELLSKRTQHGTLSEDEEERYAQALNDCRMTMTVEDESRLSFLIANINTNGRTVIPCEACDMLRKRNGELLTELNTLKGRIREVTESESDDVDQLAHDLEVEVTCEWERAEAAEKQERLAQYHRARAEKELNEALDKLKDIKPVSAVVEDDLQSALRKRLMVLLEQSLDIRTLALLEKTARKGRDLLSVGREATAMACAIDETNMGSMVSVEPLDSGTVIGLPTTTKAENFGTAVMREFIGALSEFSRPKAAEPTLTETLLAMDIAKRNGLTDALNQLQDRLRGQLPSDDVILPASPEKVNS
jgi:hypothetical protein